MPTIDISRYDKKKTPPSQKDDTSGFLAFMNKDISFGSQELSDKKKEFLYLELSSLLQAGINLKSSFELITASQEKEKDKQLFQDIQKEVLQGASFSHAMKKSGKFSVYEIVSLEIGEETGKLTEVLQDLAKFYQNKVKQRRKIISSLSYPCIVLCTSMGAVFFMLEFVVPMFSDIFTRFGGQLPWITAKIISISKIMEGNFFTAVLLLAAITGFLWYIRKTERFRKVFSGLLLKTPLVGNLVQKIYLARFCNSMRLLISAHIHLLRAISLSRKMIGYYPIESSLQKVEEDILQGQALHRSLEQFSIYPAKMIMLLKIGEESNKLDYFFARVSEQYIDEVQYRTTTLSSMMEPFIVIFLGLIVGTILIAMYLPMFEMSNSFH